ncbi:hypothetical protein OKW41_007015 [Paraburkholderia sp. UCT70]
MRPGLLILCPSDLDAKTRSRWEVDINDLVVFGFKRSRAVTPLASKMHESGRIGARPLLRHTTLWE